MQPERIDVLLKQKATRHKLYMYITDVYDVGNLGMVYGVFNIS